MSATNRGSKREDRDFYPTPLTAFEPLLPYLPKPPSFIWEPACGDGRLINAMRGAGLNAGGSDLSEEVDYLDITIRMDCIVTNPPYSLAMEFIQHALKHSDETFMLLRLSFLGAQYRREWWRANEPNALFVLSKRPCFVKGGSDNCEYAWFYWGPRHSGIMHL
jgi:hypothetical protein